MTCDSGAERCRLAREKEGDGKEGCSGGRDNGADKIISVKGMVVAGRVAPARIRMRELITTAKQRSEGTTSAMP